MVPFNVVHEDLFALNFRDLNGVLEKHTHFTTFAECTIDFTLQIFITLNCNLLSHKFFYIQEFLTKKVLHYYCVVIMQSINHSGFVFLLKEFDLCFRVLCNDVLDFSMVGDSAHFLLNVHVEFITNDMVIQ